MVCWLVTAHQIDNASNQFIIRNSEAIYLQGAKPGSVVDRFDRGFSVRQPAAFSSAGSATESLSCVTNQTA